MSRFRRTPRILFTPAATNPYTITASPGLTLTISGVGIVNNSGTTQNFVTAVDASGGAGTIVFSNSATAGSNVSIFNPGGTINFLNTSTAGSATIRNFSDGSTFPTTNFFNRSTAGNSTILNESGSVLFANNSTAGSAFIDLDFMSSLQFANHSTAANSTITTFYNSGVAFSDNSTAGSASIGVVDGTVLFFLNTSTAGSASIGALHGLIFFEDSSRGGTAQVDLRLLDFGSFLFISGHNAPGVTIGSMAGDEFSFVLLGANNLTIGSNNLSTTFSGVISDAGQGGSLTKIGTGTFILSGANTYTGDTNVNRGVLQVDGSIKSNTFVNGAGTLAGTGTINGNVTNNGMVNPGSAGAPGMLTIVHNYTQA
jgi:autotransporter-associated beta strand protein